MAGKVLHGNAISQEVFTAAAPTFVVKHGDPFAEQREAARRQAEEDQVRAEKDGVERKERLKSLGDGPATTGDQRHSLGGSLRPYGPGPCRPLHPASRRQPRPSHSAGDEPRRGLARHDQSPQQGQVEPHWQPDRAAQAAWAMMAAPDISLLCIRNLA